MISTYVFLTASWFRMNKVLLLAGILLAHASLGDSNAGHYREAPRRRPRHQRVRPRLGAAPVKVEPPAERRTFITALLAAEVAYLEGLLADQATQASANPGHHQRPTVQHKHKHSAPYQATKPVKYVSKLDPFYMIAAPDLTKEYPKTESYDAPKENPTSSYAAPAVTTTTAKYGELEHYNLGSYLPPPAKVAPQYEEPAPAPAYAPPPNSYQIATTTAPPPATTTSYKASDNSYVNLAPSYEAPAPAPEYEQPAPTYAQPAPAASPVQETKLVLVPNPSYAPGPSSYSLPPAPSYAPRPPSYPAPKQPSYNLHPHTFFHDAQAAKVHDKSDQLEDEIGDNIGSSSNAAPMVGSSGEFPTIFYNNLGGTSKNTLIL